MNNHNRHYISYYVHEGNPDSLVIWGIGSSEEDALNDAFKNMKDNLFLRVLPCTQNFYEFTKKHGGMKAVEHSCLHISNDVIDLIPTQKTVDDICDKHKISGKAREDLKKLLQGPIDYIKSIREGKND